MRSIACLAGLVLLAFAAGAGAQYPTKPVRLIVPFPAGGSADAVARAMALPLGQALGQPVVVENRPGGEGAIAADVVLKSAPDGHTLFLATNSALSAVPAMRRMPPYDPVADFTPITDVGRFTFFVFVNPQVPAATMRELIDHVRANPGKLSYASSTSTGMIAVAQLRAAASLDMLQVPYKGEGQATVDLIANRIQLLIATPTNAMGAAKEGRLRVLGTLLPERSPMLPSAPTMQEAGVTSLTIVPWGGLFGPKGLPAEVVERVGREARAVLARADMKEQFERQAFLGRSSTPEVLAELVREQLALWKVAVKEAGIPLE